MSSVVVGALALPPPESEETGCASLVVSVRALTDEGDLLDACQAVAARQDAFDILLGAVADISPADPRHQASYAVAESLRSDWLGRLAHVCSIRARGSRGLSAKAALLSGLIERDEHDAVQGGPVPQLAASLADDVLLRDCS